MPPFAVTVRYRFSEDGLEDRAASFHGLFYDRSEAAVINRLREVHRFAARIEIIEILWPGAGEAAFRHIEAWPAKPVSGLFH